MGGGKGSLFLFIFKENWAVRVAVPFLNDPQAMSRRPMLSYCSGQGRFTLTGPDPNQQSIVTLLVSPTLRMTATWAGERTQYSFEIREMALAHQAGTAVSRPYDRSDLPGLRRQIDRRMGGVCVFLVRSNYFDYTH
jgi:hypothetical protein